MSTPLIINRVTLDGVQPSASTADGVTDHTIPDNDGNIIIAVQNPTGSDVVVTAVTQASIAGISLANSSRTCPHGVTTYFGPFPPVLFNDSVDTVTISVPAAGLVLTALGI